MIWKNFTRNGQCLFLTKILPTPINPRQGIFLYSKISYPWPACRGFTGAGARPTEPFSRVRDSVRRGPAGYCHLQLHETDVWIQADPRRPLHEVRLGNNFKKRIGRTGWRPTGRL